MGASEGSKDITQSGELETKKPFQKEVKKLSKPGQKPQSIVSAPKQEETVSQPQNTIKSQNNTNSEGLLDDDILGFSEPPQQEAPKTNEINFINPMYSTTAQMAGNHAEN